MMKLSLVVKRMNRVQKDNYEEYECPREDDAIKRYLFHLDTHNNYKLDIQ